MNVSLTRELEKLVNQKVESGMYQTASEVIREGLRLLSERDKQMNPARNSLKQDVLAGFKAIEEGDYEEYDRKSLKKLANSIKSNGRKKFLIAHPNKSAT
jgi:antitoxin ParD1/3/4